MELPRKTCEQCGNDYQLTYRVTHAYLARRRFCSPECGHKATVGVRSTRFRRPLKTLEDRFWSKVARGAEEECWLWIGATQVNGYGYLGATLGRPQLKAHRLSYELNKGPITEGMLVCHRCDNPPCVNPAHLFLGTKADNSADMVEKGRSPNRNGLRNPHVKVTAEQVVEIRRLGEEGLTQQSIGARFGISQVQAGKIIKGKAWKSNATVVEV